MEFQGLFLHIEKKKNKTNCFLYFTCTYCYIFLFFINYTQNQISLIF